MEDVFLVIDLFYLFIDLVIIIVAVFVVAAAVCISLKHQKTCAQALRSFVKFICTPRHFPPSLPPDWQQYTQIYLCVMKTSIFPSQSLTLLI